MNIVMEPSGESTASHGQMHAVPHTLKEDLMVSNLYTMSIQLNDDSNDREKEQTKSQRRPKARNASSSRRGSGSHASRSVGRQGSAPSQTYRKLSGGHFQSKDRENSNVKMASNQVRRSSDTCHRKPSFSNRNQSSESLAKTFESDSTDDTKKSEVFANTKNQLQRSEEFSKEDMPIEIDIDIEQPSVSKKPVDDFTNDPHPALETPLLYFMLRRHPKLLSGIQAFYNFRWDVAYPMQNRIPCSNLLRKIKIILTWSELLLLLPFFGFLIMGTIFSFVDPSVSISGHACRTPLIFAFVTATRNSILTFFLGMPVERAIKYHKLAARLAYFNSLLHTFVAFKYPVTEDSSSNFFAFLFQDTINIGGTMLVFFMTGMIMTALPFIRKRLFELFYLVHITFALFMIVAAFYHTGFLVPVLASLTWGLDVLIRKVYMPFFRYPRKAKLEIISDTVVELSFPKQDGFDFNPGQYIFICVPKLGILQWHPFSLSSSPKQKIVTLHIRKGGNWTTDLYSLASEQPEIDILMEGPYGSVGVDLTNPYKYQTVMLFSGGIGVTPMQSLCNSLMYEHNHGMRKLQKLSFVWIERDPVVMPEVDVVRRESIRCLESCDDFDLEEGGGSGPVIIKAPFRKVSRRASLDSISAQSDADGATNLATQLLSAVPPGRETDEMLEQCYQSGDFDMWDVDETDEEDAESEAPVVPKVRPGLQRNSMSVTFNVDKPNAPWKAGDERSVDQSFLDQAFEAQNQEESPLDLQVYLTNKKVSRATKRRMPPFVTIGRPDIKNLFREARHDALRNHQPRVAVCVCAPLRIVDLCRRASAKYSDRYVAFDFHYEVFE